MFDRKKYQREWVAQRKSNWFAKNGPCVKCGSWENLELDHIDPLQKVSHRIWSWSEERRNEEIAKCQVLCHDCHLEKTNNDRPDNCRKGHPYTEGTRICHICKRETKRKSRKKLATIVKGMTMSVTIKLSDEDAAMVVNALRALSSARKEIPEGSDTTFRPAMIQAFYASRGGVLPYTLDRIGGAFETAVMANGKKS